MSIFSKILQLTRPRTKVGWKEAEAWFTGNTRQAAGSLQAHIIEPRGHLEYEIRFFTDRDEQSAWYSFYPLEDPSPEEIRDEIIKIRYNTERPWNIEYIPENEDPNA
ncbi:MAG: hypothetical protein IKF45_02585 [Lachnospiraceae bacterium]|nr:hypothetical protein [Lachnospiraceae bacterium]MBQ6363673.1 hypothetical protein [Lachnospiraceae bacterium]MBR2995575.1 hypothetical protein [Lachnospiraceae bacterium]